MRKADYIALAAIVAQHIRVLNNGLSHDERQRAYAIVILESVINNFAHRASVDKAAFLKQCGIE